MIHILDTIYMGIPRKMCGNAIIIMDIPELLILSYRYGYNYIL
jgi:hypothetical protein